MLKRVLEFLKPDKKRVVLALLVPYLERFFYYFISWIILLFQEGVSMPPLTDFIPSLLGRSIYLLVESVIYYPFACSVVVLFNYYRGEGIRELRVNRRLFTYVVIGLLVFNPFSVNLALVIGEMAAYRYYYTRPTPFIGLKVVEVQPSSAAEKMGIEKGLIISKIGYSRRERVEGKWRVTEIRKVNPSIEDAKEVLGYIDRADPKDQIVINTFGGLGHYIGHMESETLGIRVRDVNGTEAIL